MKVNFSKPNEYPISFQTVDIGVINRYTKQILCCRKPIKNKKGKIIGIKKQWQLFGGFVDVTDLSLEDAAKRELREEAGINLEVDDFRYVGSYRVPDERYLDKRDKILTAVFVCTYIFGFAKPCDDLKGGIVDWLSYTSLPLLLKKIIPKHRPIVEMVIKNLGTP